MVVHDWPIRGRRQQPAEEYGRAYARDPEKWMREKMRRRAWRARRRVAEVRHAQEVIRTRRAHGWQVAAAAPG